MTRRLPLEEGYFTIPEHDDEPPRLLGSYSRAADAYFFPRRRRCPITEQPVEDVQLSPDGLLYSWTFVEAPWMGRRRMSGDLAGHGVGQIDLPEGVRVQGIIDGRMGDWEIGMPMRLALQPVRTDEDGNELCTFKFSPVKGD